MEKLFTLKMDDELYKKLRALAFKQKVSMGELVRRGANGEIRRLENNVTQ